MATCVQRECSGAPRLCRNTGIRTVSRLRRTLAACVLSVAAALPAAAETLTDALISAYRSSNLLEQNRALLRATAARRKSSSVTGADDSAGLKARRFHRIGAFAPPGL